MLGETLATDGRFGLQATMWPMPIVAMEPIEHLGRSLIRVLIGASVGPFAKRRLNEALSFSAGLRSVWPSEDLTKAAALTGCSKASSLSKSGPTSAKRALSPSWKLLLPILPSLVSASNA